VAQGIGTNIAKYCKDKKERKRKKLRLKNQQSGAKGITVVETFGSNPIQKKKKKEEAGRGGGQERRGERRRKVPLFLAEWQTSWVLISSFVIMKLLGAAGMAQKVEHRHSKQSSNSSIAFPPKN
jgi:hypothetical protein